MSDPSATSPALGVYVSREWLGADTRVVVEESVGSQQTLRQLQASYRRVTP